MGVFHYKLFEEVLKLKLISLMQTSLICTSNLETYHVPRAMKPCYSQTAMGAGAQGH